MTKNKANTISQLLVTCSCQFRPLDNSDPTNSDLSRFRPSKFRPHQIQTTQIQIPPDYDPSQFRPSQLWSLDNSDPCVVQTSLIQTLPIQTPPLNFMLLSVQNFLDMCTVPQIIRWLMANTQNKLWLICLALYIVIVIINSF